jgi:hypothetical protein
MLLLQIVPVQKILQKISAGAWAEPTYWCPLLQLLETVGIYRPNNLWASLHASRITRNQIINARNNTVWQLPEFPNALQY